MFALGLMLSRASAGTVLSHCVDGNLRIPGPEGSDSVRIEPVVRRPLSPVQTSVLKAALGGRARVLAIQEQQWVVVPEPDLRDIPERLELELNDAAPLHVRLTVDRTSCSRTGTEGDPAWLDVDTVIEIRLGDRVLSSWQDRGMIVSFQEDWIGFGPGLLLLRPPGSPPLDLGTGMVGPEPTLGDGRHRAVWLGHGREVLLATLNQGPFPRWQLGVLDTAVGARPGSAERRRLFALLGEIDRAEPGLSGEARAAFRSLVGRRRISNVDRRRAGPGVSPGESALAGANLGPHDDLLWWVAGVEVPSGTTAPIGGLVDLRWEGPSHPFWAGGPVITSLGPGVTVQYDELLHGPRVLAASQPPCARFGSGAEWEAHGGALPVSQTVPHPTAPNGVPVRIVATRDGVARGGINIVPGLPGLYEYVFTGSPPHIEVRYRAGASLCPATEGGW